MKLLGLLAPISGEVESLLQKGFVVQGSGKGKAFGVSDRRSFLCVCVCVGALCVCVWGLRHRELVFPLLLGQSRSQWDTEDNLSHKALNPKYEASFS